MSFLTLSNDIPFLGGSVDSESGKLSNAEDRALVRESRVSLTDNVEIDAIVNRR